MYFHDLPLFVKNTILLHGVLVLYNILFYDFKQLLLIKQWQQAKLPVVQDTCHPTTNPNLKGNVMSRKVMMCTIALTAVVNVINSPRPPNNWPNTSAVRTYVRTYCYGAEIQGWSQLRSLELQLSLNQMIRKTMRTKIESLAAFEAMPSTSNALELLKSPPRTSSSSIFRARSCESPLRIHGSPQEHGA